MQYWMGGAFWEVDFVLHIRWTGEQTRFPPRVQKKLQLYCLVSKDALALMQSAAWELFVCCSLKKQPLWPSCSFSLTPCLWFLWPEFKLLYVAAGSTPCWLYPDTLRHTYILRLCFLHCYFNNAALYTPPLDTICIDCVPRKGLVFYITSDILLDSLVVPVSESGFLTVSAQPPCLLPLSPLKGCWCYSPSEVLTRFFNPFPFTGCQLRDCCAHVIREH